MDHEEIQALQALTARLLRCPFCGEAGEMTMGRSAGDRRPFFNPSCADCNYVFADGFYNADDAVRAWNERVEMTVEMTVEMAAKVVYQKYGANLAAFWRDAFAAEAQQQGRTDVDKYVLDGNCIHYVPICRTCQIATLMVQIHEKEAIKNSIYDAALTVLCDPDLFDDPETANKLALRIQAEVA